MSSALQELLDKRELDELLHTTMLTMDGGDWITYRKGLLDDAEFDFTDHRAAGDASTVLKGADHYVSVLALVIEGFDSTQHSVSNIIHAIDGDSAKTACYVNAEHFFNNDSGDRSVTCGGRYDIVFRRTAEGWKLGQLKWTTLWFRGNTALYAMARDARRRKMLEQ